MENIKKCSVAIFKDSELLTVIEIPFFEGFQVGHKIRIEDPNNKAPFKKLYNVSITEIGHHYYYNNDNTIFVHEIRVFAS